MRDTEQMEAFYAFIGKDTSSGCWPWLGRTLDGARAVFHWEGQKHLGSHFALRAAGHPRPDRASALHACDNPNCVNPDHLWWGTQAENMADMAAKGRANAPKGEASPLARLTNDAVRAIRRSTEPNSALAVRYGVDKSKICRIKNRKAWTHVED